MPLEVPNFARPISICALFLVLISFMGMISGCETEEGKREYAESVGSNSKLGVKLRSNRWCTEATNSEGVSRFQGMEFWQDGTFFRRQYEIAKNGQSNMTSEIRGQWSLVGRDLFLSTENQNESKHTKLESTTRTLDQGQCMQMGLTQDDVFCPCEVE